MSPFSKTEAEKEVSTSVDLVTLFGTQQSAGTLLPTKEETDILDGVWHMPRPRAHQAHRCTSRRINGQLNTAPALVGWQQSSCKVPRYLRHCGYIAMCGCSYFMLEKKDKRNVCPNIHL
jgi:hypothetical protein